MDQEDETFHSRLDSILTKPGPDHRVRILAWLSASVALCSNKRTRILIEKAIDQKASVLQVKEIILQSYLFCGFPPAIEGLIVFNRVLHDRHLKDENFSDYRDPQKIMQDGLDLCEVVYGKNYSKLLSNMTLLSTDISNWMITEGYGKVLSRGILTTRERELAVIAALAVQRRKRQLISHIRGASHTGATKEEMSSILSGLDLITDKSTAEEGLRVLHETIN
jgi:alkylhydroperoxidase/carboxymuconolactone decarboxylase family protein YurZ